MKLAGRTFDGPNVELIVLPRPSNNEEESNDIVIKAQAVLDYEEFEALMPVPKPPMVRKRGEDVASPDTNDLSFKEAVSRWARFQTHWMVLKSLEATPGLEWETIDLKNPDTWGNYVEEFKKAGFTTYEINRIVGLVISVNGLSDEKLKEAKQRFLATQGKAQSR